MVFAEENNNTEANGSKMDAQMESPRESLKIFDAWLQL